MTRLLTDPDIDLGAKKAISRQVGEMEAERERLQQVMSRLADEANDNTDRLAGAVRQALAEIKEALATATTPTAIREYIERWVGPMLLRPDGVLVAKETAPELAGAGVKGSIAGGGFRTSDLRVMRTRSRRLEPNPPISRNPLHHSELRSGGKGKGNPRFRRIHCADCARCAPLRVLYALEMVKRGSSRRHYSAQKSRYSRCLRRLDDARVAGWLAGLAQPPCTLFTPLPDPATTSGLRPRRAAARSPPVLGLSPDRLAQLAKPRGHAISLQVLPVKLILVAAQ